MKPGRRVPVPLGPHPAMLLRPVEAEVDDGVGGVAVVLQPLPHRLPLEDSGAGVDAAVAEEPDLLEHLPDGLAAVVDDDELPAYPFVGFTQEAVVVPMLPVHVSEQEDEIVRPMALGYPLRRHR